MQGPLILVLLFVTVGGELTLDVYDNSALAGSPVHTSALSSLSFDMPLDKPFSAEVTGVIEFPASHPFYAFNCSFEHTQLAFVWIQDHLVCHTTPIPFGNTRSSTDGSVANPLNLTNGATLPVIVHIYSDAVLSAGDTAHISVEWIALDHPDSISSVHVSEVIPSSALSPKLPIAEKQRIAFQKRVKENSGWNTWSHNMLEMVKLPDSCALATYLCQLSTRSCLMDTFIEDSHAQIRAGYFAADLSYWQFYIAYKGVNVSMSYKGGSGAIHFLAEPQNCDKVNCSDYAIVLSPRFLWYRVGKVDVSTPSAGMVTLSPLGQTPFTVAMTRPTENDLPLPDNVVKLPHIALSLGKGAVGLAELVSTGALSSLSPPASYTPLPTVQSINTTITTARDAELARYHKFGNNSEIVAAVQAATMWNYIYVPAEYGPFLPVSRSWNFVKHAINDDWTYVIFDWDNFFASYLISFTSKDIAYSNIIQVTRSKTAEGFIPNFSAGGSKSQDRTEPPVGARVLLEIFKKYKDVWLVELLFDDLLAWNDWFLRQRTLTPLGLVSLGSNKIDGYGDYAPNTMQGARFESGLDNSPMYDGDFFNKTVWQDGSYAVGQMQLYDVGMAGMFVADAEALSQLAIIINRTSEANMLSSRAQKQRLLISKHLWDEQGGIFTNLFWNNSFYRRISPTSFYALMARAATDAQAESMVNNWLLSPEHFCIAPEGDFSGNHDDCYWGLPSIQRADSAFPALGYWRGYVWGPMAQLTYWSLLEYDHVPAVRKGRKALCKQMSDLMLFQWTKNRHICENFNPHKTAGDCSGTKFYHWGALTGMIELVEAGLY